MDHAQYSKNGCCTLTNVQSTVATHEIEKFGVEVVGKYPVPARGRNLDEVTVIAGSDVNWAELRHRWKMVPCLRVTMFGVEQDVKNADIARECKVEVVGCHLSGNHYSLTKDITVDLRPESNLRRLSDFCRQWKSVSNTAVNTLPAPRSKVKQKHCVIMLQVVIPEHVHLTNDDMLTVLAEYLCRCNAEYVKYNSHGGTCVTPPADPTELTKNAIYTFFITCPKKTALSYTQLSRPFMDAHPLRVGCGGTVYLHTIQLSRKPDVYKPKMFSLPERNLHSLLSNIRLLMSPQTTPADDQLPFEEPFEEAQPVSPEISPADDPLPFNEPPLAAQMPFTDPALSLYLPLPPTLPLSLPFSHPLVAFVPFSPELCMSQLSFRNLCPDQ
eukprot:TRINITY_DN2202_c1_g2_i1.p1 TRINITY_DN2202_c1_g2~~TRINITY_DN2202_c1_g2_i1.p1  ORF type:complete len:411 (+),score=24.65 TRINITY_DN2202_c1_g2_i1:83-1234(+)